MNSDGLPTGYYAATDTQILEKHSGVKSDRLAILLPWGFDRVRGLAKTSHV
jgi:hypothetical protein